MTVPTSSFFSFKKVLEIINVVVLSPPETPYLATLTILFDGGMISASFYKKSSFLFPFILIIPTYPQFLIFLKFENSFFLSSKLG